MARIVFRTELIAYLMANKGEIVFLDNIMEALPSEAQRSSVRSVMRKFVDEGPFKITVLAAGNCWRVGSEDRAPTVAERGIAQNRSAQSMRELDQAAVNRSNGKADPGVDRIGPFAVIGEMADGSQLVRLEATNQMYTLKAL